MTGIELASWSFPVLLALIFIRVPIGLAMAVCGLVSSYNATKAPPSPNFARIITQHPASDPSS